eukprot:8292272-Pyramimonas_sp.AAC.1
MCKCAAFCPPGLASARGLLEPLEGGGGHGCVDVQGAAGPPILDGIQQRPRIVADGEAGRRPARLRPDS